MAGHDSSTKAILYALLANLGIAIAKGIAALLTGSGSMLAETVHSFSDCANQLLLFLGLNRAKKPPTATHPLGYGKVIYFWSFIVAILLFSMGGLFSIYEGVHRLSEHEPIESPYIALGVLAVSILLEGFSLLGAIKEIKHLSRGKSILHWLKHTRRAEIAVVFGEDSAAIAGLSFAFVFVLISVATGNPVFDAIGSIVIGAILVVISGFLVITVKSLLIGKSAAPEITELLHNLISANDRITEVFNIITMQFGPDVMLAAKIRMDSSLSIDEACRHINDLEKEIKATSPEIAWCFIEPDILK